jgi:hypothetical protein
LIGREFIIIAVGHDAVAIMMQEEEQRPNLLGLTEEEEALYEILTNHLNVIHEFKLIKELVKIYWPR